MKARGPGGGLFGRASARRKIGRPAVLSSVVDPTFHFYADTDPDPDTTPKLYTFGKSVKKN